jgi:hypothetical protein
VIGEGRRTVRELDAMNKVVTILTPYAKDAGALAGVGLDAHILDDLGIEIGDDDVALVSSTLT